MSTPYISIVDISVRMHPVQFRLPFNFGNTVVTGTHQAFVTVSIDVGGAQAEGRSAQLMVPRWFDKRSDRSNDDTVADLKLSCDLACKFACSFSNVILAEASSRIRNAVEASMPLGTPRLAAHFGPALVEMALIDALCSAYGLNVPQAAKRDLFGVATMAAPDITAEAITSALAGIAPLQVIAPRQTVGFDAPLFSNEFINDGPDDGQPVSLEDIIRTTGTRAFKIKLKGNPEADIDRLTRIAKLVGNINNCRVTLDANEQYSIPHFAAFIELLTKNTELQDFQRTIAFIEQPFAREEALSHNILPELSTIPLIIDESDDHDGAFATAISNGWSGTSIKSCKGVLRALLNYARVQNGKAKGKKLFISAEDLTCQLGLCWQQDTLVAATLGCSDIERNGHHFGGGMQGYDEVETARLLIRHPDIYRKDDSHIGLRIEGGAIKINSLFQPGFGR